MAGWRSILPLMLTGLLLFNLADAVVNGGRENWIRVAVVALGLALVTWWRTRAE